MEQSLESRAQKYMDEIREENERTLKEAEIKPQTIVKRQRAEAQVLEQPSPPEEQFFDKEEQIIEIIESQIDREEFGLFIKALFLYTKNIISLYEFTRLTEDTLVKIDKEVLGYFKSSLEAREKARQAMNPFNIRILSKKDKTLNDEMINISYRKINHEDLQLVSQFGNDINQEYVCLAMGNEGEGEGGGNHFVKN